MDLLVLDLVTIVTFFVRFLPIRLLLAIFFNNKYFKLGYISKQEMTLLWNIYWNFVLNDFRFDDKFKSLTKINTLKECKPKHIGMKMLNELNT